MSNIDGRIRLIAKEDAPGFVYAPQSPSPLNGGRKRRIGVLAAWLGSAALCVGFWALVYTAARHVLS